MKSNIEIFDKNGNKLDVFNVIKDVLFEQAEIHKKNVELIMFGVEFI